MANIEVELRSFIDKVKFEELKDFFTKKGNLLKEDKQLTYYFDSPEDLRIQLNDKGSKIWLKKGKIHDEAREELEIECAKDDFGNLKQLFETLGYLVEVVWKRDRLVYDWSDVKVSLDFTEGYGYILELEKLTTEENKKEALTMLRSKLKELNITPTPRSVFEERYDYYKSNWQSLIDF